jgi:hypothetical protein
MMMNRARTTGLIVTVIGCFAVAVWAARDGKPETGIAGNTSSQERTFLPPDRTLVNPWVDRCLADA